MSQKINVTADEVKQLIAKGDYANAINVFGALVERKEIHEELFYDVAYAYYKLGDYERSANWVHNTLSKIPAHVPAKLLLAKICFDEKLFNDGMALYENLLKTSRQQLSYAEQADMCKLVQDKVNEDMAEIKRNFPKLAKLIKSSGGMPNKEDETEVVIESSDLVVTGVDEPEKQVGLSPVTPSIADTAEQSKPKSEQSVLERLKSKIAEARARDAEIHTKLRDEHRTYESDVSSDSKAMDVPSGSDVGDNTPKVAQIIDNILKQSIPVKDKVRTLNSFAGYFYAEDKLAEAKTLLKEALNLDSGSDFTIKNMALVINDMGDRDTALKLVAQMQRPDFTLIRHLKG